jgi:hypothetical protein
MGRDARRRQRGIRIYGQRIGCALRVFAVAHHLWQVQGVARAGRDGGADQARGVADHEGHFLGADVLGGDDEVAFVLAGGVVQDDDELAISWAWCQWVVVRWWKRGGEGRGANGMR